jgi:hypothetical protein
MVVVAAVRHPDVVVAVRHRNLWAFFLEPSASSLSGLSL